MGVTCSYIVLRAAEAVGLKDFNGEAMEGDDFRKVFLALQDCMRSLNSDPAVLFGVSSVSARVNGSVLTFKPYTDAEQAIIDGGGSVDITDRVVTVRPTIAPAVYIGGSRISMVDPLDLPLHCSSDSCAWEQDWDEDRLVFGANVGDVVTMQMRKPVHVPAAPTEEIQVPERFYDYITLSLAVALAVKIGSVETLAALKESLARETVRITGNNNYTRPILLDSCMSRFGSR